MRHGQFLLTPREVEDNPRFSYVEEDQTGTKLSVPWIADLGKSGETASALLIHDDVEKADYIVWAIKSNDGITSFIRSNQHIKGINKQWNNEDPMFDPKEKTESECHRTRFQAIKELASRIEMLVEAMSWPNYNDGTRTNIDFIVDGNRSPVAPALADH